MRKPYMTGNGPMIYPAPSGIWEPPQEFEGQTVFVLGGGSSLSGFDTSVLSGKRVIATNEAGLTVYPDADVLFYADSRWYDWNKERMGLFKGRHIVTRPPMPHSGHKVLARTKTLLTPPRHRWEVGGYSSGEAAVQLAVHMGAKRIVLLGFDMKPGHFHDKHKVAVPQDTYKRFMHSFEVTAKWCKGKGVEVLNATPDSALMCFEKVECQNIL